MKTGLDEKPLKQKLNRWKRKTMT